MIEGPGARYVRWTGVGSTRVWCAGAFDRTGWCLAGILRTMTGDSDEIPDQPATPSEQTRLTVEQAAAVADARAVANGTRRVVAPALEELLYQAIPVLDKGFVRVIDYMGDDHAIVQAARVSYGAGTKTVRTDAGLIDYLMRHQHTSPFEMCDI